MPKRKEPELDPKSQYERFREAAKKAELADDERAFERGFKVVAPKQPVPKAKSKQKARKAR